MEAKQRYESLAVRKDHDYLERSLAERDETIVKLNAKIVQMNLDRYNGAEGVADWVVYELGFRWDKKIPMIKLYREMVQVGLKEAKDAIEAAIERVRSSMK